MNQGRELMVGAVILVALAVAVVGTIWLQGSNFGRPSIPMDVLAESVGQLSEGNAVTYRGVRIGKVATVAVEPGGTGVRISLLLDQDVGLPEDAAVVLGPESLFGDWQAEIVSRASFPRYPFFDVSAGAGTDPRVVGGYALPELSRLTASAEQISLNLAELTNRLELAFNQETADNLSNAIANIEAITQEVRALVRQQGEIAGDITASADSALSEVATAARTARESFERIDGMLERGNLDTTLVNLNGLTAELRDLTTELNDDETGLAATLEHADTAFVRLDRITARIEAGEGSLGRLLVDNTFAIRAEDLLLQLDMLLQDVRLNPRRYLRLSIF